MVEGKQDMWYGKIFEKILRGQPSVLFLIDPCGISNYQEIKDILKQYYSRIIKYKSEMKLRQELRKKEEGLLVVFQDKRNIPFDLFEREASSSINFDDVFPLLDSNTLIDISFDYFQEIFQTYIDEIHSKGFERLSKIKSQQFIDSIMERNKIHIKQRMANLELIILELLDQSMEDIDIWGKLSECIGEMNYIVHSTKDVVYSDLIRKYENIIAECFTAFIEKSFKKLVYNPKSKFNSNLLKFIFEKNQMKNAIICLDCMGFEEWNIVKDYLQNKTTLKFSVDYAITMLPSETTYSRLAIFADQFPKEIRETNNIKKLSLYYEEQLFKRFLAKHHSIQAKDILFEKRSNSDKLSIDFKLFHDYKAIGLIFSFIDNNTHLRDMTKELLIKNVRNALEESNLHVLISTLIKQGFHVFLCSDHGSIYATGNGIKQVSSSLVDAKGKRYQIFPTKDLAEEQNIDNTIVIQLPNIIGDEYLVLLTNDEMFAGRTVSGLTHGGISIQEMIIPFVEVKANDERI